MALGFQRRNRATISQGSSVHSRLCFVQSLFLGQWQEFCLFSLNPFHDRYPFLSQCSHLDPFFFLFQSHELLIWFQMEVSASVASISNCDRTFQIKIGLRSGSRPNRLKWVQKHVSLSVEHYFLQIYCFDPVCDSSPCHSYNES
jgi:hypothetical protein